MRTVQEQEKMTKIQKIARKLYWTFYWAGTPQGRDYWADVHKNLCTMGGVDSSHAEWRSTKNYTTPEDPIYYKRIRKLADRLKGAFFWGSSEQDSWYWIGVHDNLLKLATPPQVSEEIKIGDLCLVWDDGRPSIDRIMITRIREIWGNTHKYRDSKLMGWKHAKKLSPELVALLGKELRL